MFSICVARDIAQDVNELEKMSELWTKAFKSAVKNHSEVQSIAKENTDTESSGVRYSKAEIKNALTKEEYKRVTAAFMKDDTSAIIEDCAIRVTNKNDVYKIKIVCYNLFDDGYDFQITEVYQIENYDYNIHSGNEDPAVIIAKGVRDGYTKREIEALLQNNKFDDGQIFKRFSPQSGRYYRLKGPAGRSEHVSGEKSSRSGLSGRAEQAGTESSGDTEGRGLEIKNKFSLSEPIEQTKDLIAVHNLNEAKLKLVFELGGFAMPSIAVTRADMGHGEFGEISVIFDKETIDDLTEEVSANVAEALLKSDKFLTDLFSDEEFIKHISGTEQPKSFMEKVMAKLKELVNAIKDFMKGASLNHSIAEKVSEDVNELEKVSELWTKAFKSAVKNHSEVQSIAKENTDTESSGGVKYSKKEDSENSSIKQQIRNNLDKLDGTDSVADVITPTEFKDMKTAKRWILDTLKATGYAVDRQNFGKILFDEKLINESLNYINSFTEIAAFATLPKVLKRGIFIDEHQDHKDRKYSTVTIAAKVNVNGTDGIVGIVIKRTNGNNFKMLRILSPDGSEFSFTEKKKNNTLTGKGLPQRALANPTDAVSGNTIPQPPEIVNPDSKKSLPETDSKGNSLSEQQREYFKDSKIVDKSGNLLVLYHQTKGDFTEFDTHHKGAGHDDFETPYGIFMKPDSSDIGLGGVQMELYANITNPLKVNNREHMSEYLQRDEQYKKAVEERNKADKRHKEKTDSMDAKIWDYMLKWKAANPDKMRADILFDTQYIEMREEYDKAMAEWSEEVEALSVAAKQLVNGIFEENGYDGVIIENDAGSFGRSTRTIIAFNANQVKSTNNYNPSESNDIRFSLPESDTGSFDILSRENEDLKAQVEALENEMKLTKGHKVKPEAVKKLARRLIKEYSSTLSVDEVAEELEKIFNYVADTENASADIASRAMYSLAKRIIDSSQRLDTTLADEYKHVTDYLRKVKIRVSPGMEAELDYLYGKYNNFRRANFGRLNLSRDNGSAVDSVWQELNSLAPELFPEEAFPDSDMLPRIAEFLDMVAPEYVNPYGQDADTFISGLASEIFDSYFDTPEVKTFADKKADELRKAVNKSRKHLAQLRAKDKAKYQERYEKLKADSKEKIGKIKADNKRKTAEKLLKQQAKYQGIAKEKAEKQRETAEKSKLRRRIEKNTKTMLKWFDENSDKHHIPEVLREAAAIALGTLDFVSYKQRENERDNKS